MNLTEKFARKVNLIKGGIFQKKNLLKKILCPKNQFEGRANAQPGKFFLS